MFRYILDLIVIVVIITMLRSVIGVLMKFLSGGFAAPPSSAQAPRGPRAVPTGGELKKDPVCGTFIAASTAIQKKVGNQTYYFCSTDCRNKFRA